MASQAIAISAAIASGVLAWSGAIWTIPVSLALLVLAAAEKRPIQRQFLAFGYYLAASWPLAVVARRHFSISPPLAVLLLILAAGLLSVPWLLRSPTAALSLSALPPWGLIGWASPLLSAGVLLPGLSWIGLLLVAVVPSLFVPRFHYRGIALVTIAAISIATNVATKPIRRADGWTGINLSHSITDPLSVFSAFGAVAIKRQDHKFVLPEGAVDNWSVATELFWSDFSAELKERRLTLLLGTKLSDPNGRFRNVVKGIGESNGIEFPQRVPVPFAMWNPFSRSGGFEAQFFGEPTFRIADTTVAPFVCYEQLLMWTQVTAAMAAPDIALAISSQRWTRGTPIENVQRAAMLSWSRLFSIPVVESIRM